MRNLIFIFLSVVLFSCNDDKKTPSTASGVNGQDTVSVDSPPPGDIQEERDAVQTDRAEEVKKTQPDVVYSGRYRKIVDDAPATDCNCNCIEVDFDAPSEWCIDKDKMYITARTQKTGDNSADIYFVSASEKNSPDTELPWDEFDTDTPVATITFQPDGSAELDWLGFAVNGEVATDYALYGKKTLEGTYNRE